MRHIVSSRLKQRAIGVLSVWALRHLRGQETYRQFEIKTMEGAGYIMLVRDYDTGEGRTHIASAALWLSREYEAWSGSVSDAGLRMSSLKAQSGSNLVSVVCQSSTFAVLLYSWLLIVLASAVFASSLVPFSPSCRPDCCFLIGYIMVVRLCTSFLSTEAGSVQCQVSILGYLFLLLCNYFSCA